VITFPKSKEIISGYRICKDIEQNPGFILKTDVTRKIFKQGMNTWLYFNIAVVFIGAVFVLATMSLMETSGMMKDSGRKWNSSFTIAPMPGSATTSARNAQRNIFQNWACMNKRMSDITVLQIALP